jgi:hypothetical protein
MCVRTNTPLRSRERRGGGVYLALNEVSNARLGHDGNGNGLHDLLDEFGVAHTRDAALGADIGGHALERHDGGGAGLFGDTGLFRFISSGC